MKGVFYKKYLVFLLVSGMVSLSTTSCKDSGSEITPDTKSTQVTDLPGDTEASVGEGGEQRSFYPLIFNFGDGSHQLIRNASDSAQYLKTNLWDIAFTGIYNSEVFVNNGSNRDNPGFGGPASGTAVVMLEKAYDHVTEAPSDQEFNNSSITKIGWASGAGSPGWFFYSLDNHISVPIKNRTYVIRLADGKYAKLEIQNIYKNNPPVVTDMYWPAPFLSFRYYVQPDGSKNLATR